MKLTKMLKEAFVHAVLADTPKPDFYGKITAIVAKYREKYLSKAWLEILADENSRHQLKIRHVYFSEFRKRESNVEWSINSFSLYGPNEFLEDPEFRVEMAALIAEVEEYDVQVHKIKTILTAQIEQCSTLAKAKVVLPEELQKYLPEEIVKPATPNLPILFGDALTELKSMGFPIGKQNATA